MSVNRVNKIEICRCCLDKGRHIKWYPLCGEIINVDTELKDMLEFCTKTEVSMEDDLPREICEMCFKLLRIAYNFLQKFEESEKLLFEERNVTKIEIIELDENYYESEFKLQHEVEVDTTDCLDVEQNEFPETADSQENIIIIPCNVENKVSTNKQTSEENGSIQKIHYSKEIQKQSDDRRKGKVPMSNVSQTPLAHIVYYRCPICDVKKRTLKSFRSHLISHRSNSLTCPCCPNSDEKYDIRTYIEHYTISHKYKCPHCSKIFKNTYNLLFHMKRHRPERPYVCQVEGCDKKFYYPGELKRHSHVHSNTKDHICKLCGASFYTYDTMRYHQKTHGGQKNYLCTFCGKRYFLSCHLKAHVNSNHSTNRIKCKYCSAAYRSRTGLKKHYNVCTAKT